jgi:uncharacterized protein (TIGR02246 family)
MNALQSAAAITALALATSACAIHKSRTTSCETTENALQAVIVGLIAGDNSGDLEHVLDTYTEDVVWLPPRGAALNGKAAIKLRYEQMFESFDPSLSVVISESLSDGRLGFVSGRTAGQLEPIGAGQSVTIDDKFLAILQCKEGRWRVSHLAWIPRDN